MTFRRFSFPFCAVGCRFFLQGTASERGTRVAESNLKQHVSPVLSPVFHFVRFHHCKEIMSALTNETDELKLHSCIGFTGETTFSLRV